MVDQNKLYRELEMQFEDFKGNHPFPNKEIVLIEKLNREKNLDAMEIETLSQLLQKYLELRSQIFHR